MTMEVNDVDDDDLPGSVDNNTGLTSSTWRLGKGVGWWKKLPGSD